MGHIQVTAEERHTIYHLRQQGMGPRAIGRALSRDPSTISRELKRNCGQRGYRPKQAQQMAEGRRQSSSRNQQLGAMEWELVERYLAQDWSPEQIAAIMKRDHQVQISHERIYQYVRADKRSGGSLHRHLRQGHRKRRKRYGSQDSRGRIPGAKSIDERPDIVDEKTRIGDWEIDTVVGAGHQHAVVTINERHTGFALVGKVPSKHSDVVIAKAIELLRPYRDRVHTITADNGKEFTKFAKLEQEIGAKVYFAHPYSSWERGANENYNGLFRQYVPKGSPMDGLTQQRCDDIAHRINTRPRKRHGYSTPHELFLGTTAGEGVALQT